MTAAGFSERNFESRRLVSPQGGDDSFRWFHNRKVTDDGAPDWYLAEWMAHLGKRQHHLVDELGWAKGRASKFVNGAHPYRREIVNELAAWLKLEPFELLMPPAKALAIRAMHEAATTIVANRPIAPADMPAMAAERGRAYEAPTPQRSPTKKAG